MPFRGYPFDPDIRDRIAKTMYGLLPILYRLRDAPPGNLYSFDELIGDLGKLINILAAPLAEVRQNVEELHADLFIDTCNDWVLPYLADMVGMQTVFPDARSNRRDIRGTVGWRRRKGNPHLLQSMAAELVGPVVVSQEGWKRVLLAQDPNQLRLERTIPLITPPTIAEHVTGPLDRAYHAIDPREVSHSSGKYHPKHIIHYLFPTQLFPLNDGTAFRRSDPLATDLRYAIDPRGLRMPLRVRKTNPDDAVQNDRVPPMDFAAAPGAFFDIEGRFSIRICGLTAALTTTTLGTASSTNTGIGAKDVYGTAGVPAAPAAERTASTIPAESLIVQTTARIRFLDYQLERLNNPVEIALLGAPPPTTGTPLIYLQDPNLVWVRATVLFDQSGPHTSQVGSATVKTNQMALIRLRPVGAKSAFFPGGTVVFTGDLPDASLSSSHTDLAIEGFLGGTLVVQLPPTWIRETRWFYLAADGTLYDAQSDKAKWQRTISTFGPLSEGGGLQFATGYPSPQTSTGNIIPFTTAVKFPKNWGGGTITVTGLDLVGNPQVEVLTPTPEGGYVVGTVVYTSISSAQKQLVGQEPTNTAILEFRSFSFPDIPFPEFDAEGGPVFSGKGAPPKVSTGPGASWPPQTPTAKEERLTRVPASLWKGPVFMHGGFALEDKLTAVHPSFPGNDPQDFFPGPFGAPAIPGALAVAFDPNWDGGDVLVEGLDAVGTPVQETFYYPAPPVHAPMPGNLGTSFPGPFVNPLIPTRLFVVFDPGWDAGDVSIVGTVEDGSIAVEVVTANPGNRVVTQTRFRTVTSAAITQVGVANASVSLLVPPPNPSIVPPVANNYAGNSAANGFPGPYQQPPASTKLLITFEAGWDAGGITIIGLSPVGAQVIETVPATPGGSRQTVNVFSAVNSIYKGTVGSSGDRAIVQIAPSAVIVPGHVPFSQITSATKTNVGVFGAGASIGLLRQVASDTTKYSLAFAVRYVSEGTPTYTPFLRLDWSGPDPARAPDLQWFALDDDGKPITDPLAYPGRFHDIATLRDSSPLHMETVVRLEGGKDGLYLPPSEVAYSSDDGRAVLIHLPTLVTVEYPSPYVPEHWMTGYNPGHASRGVSVGVDGSSRWEGTTLTARYSTGNIVPITAPTDALLPPGTPYPHPALLRRRIQQRGLCQWDNEKPNAIPPKLHIGTKIGYLDVDPAVGYFAVNLIEPPPRYPISPFQPDPNAVPPSVTVSYQEGYTDHIGARPAPREALLGTRLKRPTRLVLGSGSLHQNIPADWATIPQYRTLTDAFQAIANGPYRDEVVQFEDSATYDERPVWPMGPRTLTVQAAEQERPVLRINSWQFTEADQIHAAVSGNALDNEFPKYDAFPPAPFRNPDTPFRVTLTFAYGWDGGDVKVIGAGVDGSAQEEVFSASQCPSGQVCAGTKLFSTVTAAVKTLIGASAAPATIGVYIDADPATVPFDSNPIVPPFPGNSQVDDFAGPFNSPYGPFNVTATFDPGWDGGDVIVIGTDPAGQEQVETVPAPHPAPVVRTTVVGVKLFQAVLQARKQVDPNDPFAIGTHPTATVILGARGVYEELTLRGLVFGGMQPQPLEIICPVAKTVRVQFCTVSRAADVITFQSSSDGSLIEVSRSLTGRLKFVGTGLLKISDCAVDATNTGTFALQADQATIDVARSTVFGDVECLVLDASEVIFMDKVVALDRFHGCVRFSRVPDKLRNEFLKTWFIADIPVHASVEGRDGNTFLPPFGPNPTLTTGRAKVKFTANWAGGSITVSGVGRDGENLSEVIPGTAGVELLGANYYRQITQVSKSNLYVPVDPVPSDPNDPLYDSIVGGAAAVTLFIQSELPRKHRVAQGAPVRYVARPRSEPAHARLAEDCDVAISRGAEDGSEMGVFNGGVSQLNGVRLTQRLDGLERRFNEYTPAGLLTGIVRQD